MKTTLLLFTVFFSSLLSAQIVNIPDPEFKYILVNYESYFSITIDINEDDEIQYSEAAAFTGTLQVGDPGWVFNGNIQDLTGIEAFVNITELICLNNHLTVLDLSQNSALVKVNCAHNELISLNVSQCTALEELTCSYNQLTALGVSQNSVLEYLVCGDNEITSLNVTQNTNLKILYCNTNQLSTLNLSQNMNLEEFSGFNNQLNNLDIKNGNNTNITFFSVVNNPNLICIFVDEASFSANNAYWFKDSTATYVETQQDCADLSTQDFPFQNIEIYPNPVKTSLYVEGPNSYNSMIFNIRGKQLLKTTLLNTHQINLSSLKPGIYFLRLTNDRNQSITKKIIKL
ncbi:MAG TPA: T9SS type A sorting domain-containing protein [Flavobacteriaceae bacterium]|nr:T9SS type A sorting domain-containing protein [Flavobacteriaceae bacterium]